MAETPPKGRPPLVPPKRATTHGDRNESRARVYTPPRGFDPSIPSFVDPATEPTDVGTDAQVFRSVKALHERLDENEKKTEAAHTALTADVTALKTGFVELKTGVDELDKKQDRQSEIIEKFDEKLDKTIQANAKIAGYLEGQRDEADRRAKSPSEGSVMRMIQATTTTTIADKIIDDQIKGREWWRSTTTKIIGAALGSVGLWEIVKNLIHKAIG